MLLDRVLVQLIVRYGIRQTTLPPPLWMLLVSTANICSPREHRTMRLVGALHSVITCPPCPPSPCSSLAPSAIISPCQTISSTPRSPTWSPRASTSPRSLTASTVILESSQTSSATTTPSSAAIAAVTTRSGVSTAPARVRSSSPRSTGCRNHRCGASARVHEIYDGSSSSKSSSNMASGWLRSMPFGAFFFAGAFLNVAWGASVLGYLTSAPASRSSTVSSCILAYFLSG